MYYSSCQILSPPCELYARKKKAKAQQFGQTLATKNYSIFKNMGKKKVHKLV